VATYRLKYLDAFSGAVVRLQDFESANDEAAIAHADFARGLTPMELWHGERKIKQWSAFPPTE
jgi:hypothetical protein